MGITTSCTPQTSKVVLRSLDASFPAAHWSLRSATLAPHRRSSCAMDRHRASAFLSLRLDFQRPRHVDDVLRAHSRGLFLGLHDGTCRTSLVRLGLPSDRLSRRDLPTNRTAGPWSSRETREVRQRDHDLGKGAKLGLLHTLYGIVSLALAHVFLSYFVSLRSVFTMVQGSPAAHPEAFAWVFGLAAIFHFNFSWFREQFCVVICPYGRLQGVLVDPDSLNVGYDTKRGEPRGKASDPNASVRGLWALRGRVSHGNRHSQWSPVGLRGLHCVHRRV